MSKIKTLIDAEKNEFIEKALETTEGQEAMSKVAEEMVGSIKNQLNKSLCKNLFGINDLPPGAVAQYNKELNNSFEELSKTQKELKLTEELEDLEKQELKHNKLKALEAKYMKELDKKESLDIPKDIFKEKDYKFLDLE